MKSSDSKAKQLPQNKIEFVFRRYFAVIGPHFPPSFRTTRTLIPPAHHPHPKLTRSKLSVPVCQNSHMLRDGRTNASLPLPHPIRLSLLPHFDSGMRISILAPPSIPANHHPLSLLPPSCSPTPYRCPPDKRNPRNIPAQGCVNLLT